MTLFLSLLPLYLFGNLHCMGMCGPLVMLLCHHRYRFFYFFGRLLSFSLAGLIAGEVGAVLHLFLKQYYLAETVSLVCGIAIIGWGIKKISGGEVLFARLNTIPSLQAFHLWFSKLILKDRGWSTFLFGFFTVFLPCGQTLVVFSACALAGDALVGFGNGFAFALLTTPSLVIAMHTLTFFKKFKRYDQVLIGGCSIFVGSLACLRGLAEMGWMDHWVLNPDSSPYYHIVIF